MQCYLCSNQMTYRKIDFLREGHCCDDKDGLPLVRISHIMNLIFYTLHETRFHIYDQETEGEQRTEIERRKMIYGTNDMDKVKLVPKIVFCEEIFCAKKILENYLEVIRETAFIPVFKQESGKIANGLTIHCFMCEQLHSSSDKIIHNSTSWRLPGRAPL